MTDTHSKEPFPTKKEAGTGEHNYEDILYLSHPQSASHPPMPHYNRAAQFAPFAALTGYEESIREEARLTEVRRGRSDKELMVLSEKLLHIQQFLRHRSPSEPAPLLSVTCFQPDKKKSGGAYITVTGPVKRIDDYERCIIMDDGSRIPFADIYDISGDTLPQQNL